MLKLGDLYAVIISTIMVLLIISAVLIEFGTLDTTLAAGIIAFVGAVIGGSITLIGVNKTIKDGRERDRRKEYVGNLGHRAKLKYDVSRELILMNNLIVEEMKEMSEEEITDDYFLDLLRLLNEKCRKMIRDGIHIGEDNSLTLKELTNVIDNLFESYNIFDTDESEDETYFFSNYIYDHDPIETFLKKLYDAIKNCLKLSEEEEKKLFDEVTGISKSYE